MVYKLLNGNFKEVHATANIKVLGNLLEAIDLDLKSVEILERSLIPKYPVTGIQNAVGGTSRVSKSVC